MQVSEQVNGMHTKQAGPFYSHCTSGYKISYLEGKANEPKSGRRNYLKVLICLHKALE